MSNQYNRNYTKEEISAILKTLRDCVKKNRYTVAQNENRQENIDFKNNYNITAEKLQNILLKIKTEDFCYSLPCEHIGYEHEVLYVFVPKVTLNSFGDGYDEIVAIYVKINILEETSDDYVIVISFHEPEFDMSNDYAFI